MSLLPTPHDVKIFYPSADEQPLTVYDELETVFQDATRKLYGSLVTVNVNQDDIIFRSRIYRRNPANVPLAMHEIIVNIYTLVGAWLKQGTLTYDVFMDLHRGFTAYEQHSLKG
jgi:hypothetical protein